MKVMEELWKRYKTVDSFDTAYWEGVVVGMIMERAFIRAQEKFGQITPREHQQGHGDLQQRGLRRAGAQRHLHEDRPRRLLQGPGSSRSTRTAPSPR
ncbi:MAG: hypothetical protein MZV70_73425 [Desulfobacterales bacterium]|nr:hypothetical protein [Desulfobacterales bacterium]